MTMPQLESLATEIKDIVSIVGILIAAIALVFTAINTRSTERANRARFSLDLRTQFYRFDDVHRKLRPGGEWSGVGGPSTVDEWAQAEAYMGLFEHCEVMLEQKLIDEDQFRKIYRYRLINIVSNKELRKKLIERSDGWRLFLALLKRMGVEIPK